MIDCLYVCLHHIRKNQSSRPAPISTEEMAIINSEIKHNSQPSIIIEGIEDNNWSVNEILLQHKNMVNDQKIYYLGRGENLISTGQ